MIARISTIAFSFALLGAVPASAALPTGLDATSPAPAAGVADVGAPGMTLARNGGDDGAGHDAGDDHGAHGAGDDGAGHDAGDDHGGHKGGGESGHKGGGKGDRKGGGEGGHKGGGEGGHGAGHR